MADIWDIQVKRGNKEDLPKLKYGEIGFCSDETELYIGGVNGENVNITNNASLNDITQNIATNTNDINTLRNRKNFVMIKGILTGDGTSRSVTMTAPSDIEGSYCIVQNGNGDANSRNIIASRCKNNLITVWFSEDFAGSLEYTLLYMTI